MELNDLNLDKDYFFIKNLVQKSCLKLPDDFYNLRLNYQDNKTHNVNYGMKAWYSGFYLESFRNTYKAYLQAKNDNDDYLIGITLGNIKYCDETWNKEKIEFLKKETFFEPYHNYLNKSDIYIFSSYEKNVLKEFIWKVCYHASIFNPYWKMLFIDYDENDIYFYFEDKDGTFVKFLPRDEEKDGETEIKRYLGLEKTDKNSDKSTLVALSNFIIVNSTYFY